MRSQNATHEQVVKGIIQLVVCQTVLQVMLVARLPQRARTTVHRELTAIREFDEVVSRTQRFQGVLPRPQLSTQLLVVSIKCRKIYALELLWLWDVLQKEVV